MHSKWSLAITSMRCTQEVSTQHLGEHTSGADHIVASITLSNVHISINSQDTESTSHWALLPFSPPSFPLSKVVLLPLVSSLFPIPHDRHSAISRRSREVAVALATNATDDLHVLRHDGDTTAVGGGQLGVLEHTGQVGFGGFLK